MRRIMTKTNGTDATSDGMRQRGNRWIDEIEREALDNSVPYRRAPEL